jgi:hypothetical protein
MATMTTWPSGEQGRALGDPWRGTPIRQVSANSMLSAMSLIHNAYPQHETPTQWPHHPSQPHEQLLMGWITGRTMTINDDNNAPWHP